MNQNNQIFNPIHQSHRFFHSNHTPNLKFNSFNQPQSTQSHQYFSNVNHLHIPGKINFHQLLSLPLQKFIHKENSLKQNQTFSLKFQPQTSARQHFSHSRQSLNKINIKNTKFFSRKNFTADKIQRVKQKRNQNQQNEQQRQIKEASKTMYFKPIGKIAKNMESENFQRKSFQLSRNKTFSKNKQSLKIEMGSNLYKDKLLMLLQIRKQQRSERQINKPKPSLHNNIKSYRQIKNVSSIDNKERVDRSVSYRQYNRKNVEQSPRLIKFKRNYIMKHQKQDAQNPGKLSPWYQVENAQQF